MKRIALGCGFVLPLALAMPIEGFSTSSALAGPFTPQVAASAEAPGYVIAPGSDAAIPSASPSIVEWASGVVGSPVFGTGSVSSLQGTTAALSDSLAPPPAAVSSGLTTGGSGEVSLGEDGSITVSFSSPILNGPGNDFAVYSNGFLSGATGDAYSKFATVSVSSNGTDFFAFPANFDQSALIGATYGTTTYYELFDASNLFNIAGKYPTGFGTPFDLGALSSVYSEAIANGSLNLNDITEVKITDAWDTLDSTGNEILDVPGATTAEGTFTGSSGGFNFSGVAVLNDAQSVPEPSSLILVTLALLVIPFGFRRNKSSVVFKELR